MIFRLPRFTYHQYDKSQHDTILFNPMQVNITEQFSVAMKGKVSHDMYVIAKAMAFICKSHRSIYVPSPPSSTLINRGKSFNSPRLRLLSRCSCRYSLLPFPYDIVSHTRGDIVPEQGQMKNVHGRGSIQVDIVKRKDIIVRTRIEVSLIQSSLSFINLSSKEVLVSRWIASSPDS